ncbi:hypothetical protein CC78DRAFT_388678 [Lojkania enalia]|uniref:Uncharacterized protein n=1 Tax=Lojkania enalia TaxID=147567 RepID=A0A9P4K217_9PLEO|nr:hypothetical protein CC78DRAFT_388678 [Didymosphaeria enalia]
MDVGWWMIIPDVVETRMPGSHNNKISGEMSQQEAVNTGNRLAVTALREVLLSGINSFARSPAGKHSPHSKKGLDCQIRSRNCAQTPISSASRYQARQPITNPPVSHYCTGNLNTISDYAPSHPLLPHFIFLGFRVSLRACSRILLLPSVAP